jgi:GNAT superfamily N-acetyltransferase
MNIRAYQKRDQEPLARLWLDSWRSTGLAEAAGGDWQTLHDRIPVEIAAGWTVHVAEEDGTLLGFSAANAADNCLDQLFVAPDAQGRGIGKALLDDAKAGGPEGLWLRTPVANFGACLFYEREGFAAGEIVPHPKYGIPFVIYRWGFS